VKGEALPAGRGREREPRGRKRKSRCHLREERDIQSCSRLLLLIVCCRRSYLLHVSCRLPATKLNLEWE
jgi:hypothetical protein